MIKSDLHPPLDGLNTDPVLYGVAAALAELFPPMPALDPRGREQTSLEGEEDRDARE